VRTVTILEVESEEKGDGRFDLVLRGELDLSTVGKVQEEIRQAADREPRVLVVDLSQLTFLDSTGLRCLVKADERASEEGWRLVVVKGPEPVHRVFSITRLDERFEIVDDPSSLPSDT
jgi:anti-anti-sigma factor